MNKKLLTLAVGAALATTSGIAAAEAEWSGTFNINLQETDVEGSNDTDALDVANGGSELVLRASEDTDNGMTGWIWLDLNVDNSDGANGTDSGLTFDNALVGLSGDFGTIAGGRAGSPHKGFVSSFDLFDNSPSDTAGNHTITGGAGTKFSGIIEPVGTGVGYSNTWGEVSFAIGVQTDNGDQTQDTDNSASLVWNSGAFSLGVSTYNRDDNGAVADSVEANAESIVAVGGTWNLDNGIGLKVLFQQADDLADTTVAGSSGADSETLGLAATFPVGPGTFGIQWYDTDYNATAVASAGVGNIDDTTSYAIGYGIGLSDNVSVGATWGTIDSDTNADDSDGWDLGLTVSF